MSQIKQIDTGKCSIGVLKVEVDSYLLEKIARKDTAWWPVDHVDVEWQILGISTELTEEQCKPLFKHKDGYGLSFELPKPNNRAGYFTALAAMEVLLEANQCFSKNPYGEKPKREDFNSMSDKLYADNIFDWKLNKWQQAQQNTGTWLILRKL